jgi:hypothetical protein
VKERLRVTAAGWTPTEAIDRACLYLDARGIRGEVRRVRQRRVKTGLMGYRAWDIEFEVSR